MKLTRKLVRRILFGMPLHPFRSDTRKHMALVTFFAWIGLGADGLSSACYGPEEAFVALQGHTQMAIFLAIATAFTVFLIAAAYMQVIEMFPNGGGGYKVASELLGPYAGLVSGSALLIDYVLTIAISIASGTDSIFSVIPYGYQWLKVPVEYGAILGLIYMNMRGMKESIKILMPIFLGFVISHMSLILFGVFSHHEGLGNILPEAISESSKTAEMVGWFAVLALFFKAFSLGGGTYTGLEAVSNSVQSLAEPKIRTAKATMWCVAFSLAAMAGGIILLYLLWGAERVPGQTLNATVFQSITANWQISGFNVSGLVVTVTMLFASGVLFVAANTGFLAGPSVLANMAVDRWMPHMFSSLSSRLVTQNGVVLMGVLAMGAVFITGGRVDMLVVLYSINVFLTFSLSLLGIARQRLRERKILWGKFLIAALAFLVCATILTTTIFEKFLSGGWITLFITGMVVMLGLVIKRHYVYVQEHMEQAESDLTLTFSCAMECAIQRKKPKMDPNAQTAVLLVGETNASGMHAFTWVQKAFPKIFKNFVFVTVGEIDTEEFNDQALWNQLRRNTKQMLQDYVEFCSYVGLPSTYYHAYGTDVIEKLITLTDRVAKDFPNSIFFASKIISDNDNLLTQMLHNQTAYMLQRRLHSKGHTMIIMPLKI